MLKNKLGPKQLRSRDLVRVEIAHLLALRCWNSEVFSAISGLIGTISGIVLARKE